MTKLSQSAKDLVTNIKKSKEFLSLSSGTEEIVKQQIKDSIDQYPKKNLNYEIIVTMLEKILNTKLRVKHGRFFFKTASFSDFSDKSQINEKLRTHAIQIINTDINRFIIDTFSMKMQSKDIQKVFVFASSGSTGQMLSSSGGSEVQPKNAADQLRACNEAAEKDREYMSGKKDDMRVKRIDFKNAQQAGIQAAGDAAVLDARGNFDYMHGENQRDQINDQINEGNHRALRILNERVENEVRVQVDADDAPRATAPRYGSGM